MTPERWRQVEQVFQAALDREPSGRSALLDEACAGDTALRAEVESLLKAHATDDRYLESSAMHVAARALTEQATLARVGERLGAYELLAPIGAGGMGEVWRALDPGLRRHVAIKILSPQYAQDPDRLRRFELEAQAAGILNHPNVLSVYAIGRQHNAPYLVTELLDGVTLRQKLATGAIPEGKAIEYADQLVQGLAAAHDKGIVHRDLKPENIFITRDDRVKILDFGLAKLAPSDPEHQAQTRTASGVVLGTPAYMSPEQVRGQPTDHRSDIFSVGAVFYEMLAGRRPFLGDTGAETMTAILKEEPPPVSGVSAQVDQIVRHCLEKEPGARYQSARDLAFQLRVVRHPSSPPAAPLPTGARRGYVGALLIGVVLLATAGLTWWLTRGTETPAPPTFRRLTADSGLTTDPAFSPDGKLVAYASDRAGADLDIWVHQLATNEAVAITSDPGDESEPAFSPDGSRIAFRSERDGGGIYIVSVLGGEPRLIATHGRRPRFSPDGRHVAYWVGHFYVGKVFVAPVVGGPPVPVRPDFASALYPVWSADGTKLLFLGARTPREIPTDAFDWWIASPSGGEPTKTGATEIMRRQGIRDNRSPFLFIPPADWIGDDVFFSGRSEESTNLWRLSVSLATGRAQGTAHRLTSGTAIEARPSSFSNSRIAFASLTDTLNIWSLPLAANSGEVKGEPRQVTSSAFDARTSVSADAKRLVFISTRAGNPDVWMKDLESGKELALTATPLREEEPEITADGTRVVYLILEGARGVLYQIAAAGGVPERICDDCGRPWDWSPDGLKILEMIPEGYGQSGLSLGLFDVVTRQRASFLEHPEYSLARGRFSPDGRWVSFVATDAAGAHVVVVPFRSEAPPGMAEWVSITEHAPIPQDKPRWSPDGNLLYYTSDVDGFRCVWARRLDPATKRPLGEPIAIYHSHGARRSLANVWIGAFELSLTPDKLFFNLGETTGNIWIAEWKR